MDQVFQGIIDRTRNRLDVKRLKTIFGPIEMFAAIEAVIELSATSQGFRYSRKGARDPWG
jgi:hypothetical protein